MGLPVGMAVVLAAVTLALSGVALLRSRLDGLWLCGACLTATGLVAIAGVAAGVMDADPLGAGLLLAAGWLLLPLALLSYPFLRRRDPVLVGCAVVVLGSGLLIIFASDGVAIGAGCFSAVALVTQLWWRLEHPRADRVALGWSAVGGILVGLLAAVMLVSATTLPMIVLALGIGALGPCLVLGVFRPALLEPREVAVRLTVALVVGVAYLAAYSSVVAIVELLGGAMGAAAYALLGLALAAGVPPLAHLLRDGVEQLLFGRRRDPLVVASTVVADLPAEDPATALAAVRSALGYTSLALLVDGGPIAEVGTPIRATAVLPLRRSGRADAELVIGLRPGERRLRRADRRTLALVVPLLELTVRLSELAADLQRARQDSVTALEDERRRLRRDLHDGLGPRLSGIAYTADAIRNLVRTDPDTATALLHDLRRDTADALDEIRRIAYSMRPPALDELGLVGALQQHTRGVRTAADQPLRVRISAPSLHTDLPAAVEVTAYRLVVEAVGNVARHSGADRAEVELVSRERTLTVTVTDTGLGHKPWTPGVGIVSMRERVDALGGSLTVGPTGRGGRVCARLPLG